MDQASPWTFFLNMKNILLIFFNILNIINNI